MSKEKAIGYQIHIAIKDGISIRNYCSPCADYVNTGYAIEAIEITEDDEITSSEVGNETVYCWLCKKPLSEETFI
jgi:hypothetical protein